MARALRQPARVPLSMSLRLGFQSLEPVLAAAAVASTPLASNLWHKLPERARRIAFPVLMLAGLILSTAYLVDGTYNPFLYFRF